MTTRISFKADICEDLSKRNDILLLVMTSDQNTSFDQSETQGFAYVALMIVIVIISLASAVTIQVESFEHRRVAEERLLEVGNEYLSAVTRYAQSAPPGAQAFPTRLDDLLKDPRSPVMKRYLRRLYRDPITGSSDWGLIISPQGGIAGVYSLAKGTPIKQANFDRRFAQFEGAANYQTWRFAFLPVSTAGGQRTNAL